MAHWLARCEGTSGVDIWQWLQMLASQTPVLGSGPRPGRLHVAGLLAGGHSGRGHTFILGNASPMIDEVVVSRFPSRRRGRQPINWSSRYPLQKWRFGYRRRPGPAEQ